MATGGNDRGTLVLQAGRRSRPATCARTPCPVAGRLRRSAGTTAGLAILATLALAPAASDLAAQGITYRAGVPEWSVDPKFKHDVFTFARVQYRSWARGGWNEPWEIDYPDAELNLAFRLQQMTSLKVNPDAVTVKLDVDDLSPYPFLYIVEPGYMVLGDDEIDALRRYLLRGGFLMLDDFWGSQEWSHVHLQIKALFPDREIVDLPLDHPIFHCVFDLKEKPQVPGIHYAWRGYEDDGRDVHYRAIFDDNGRMMVIICQNTDLGDGWEREGANVEYFHKYAEKRAYPMAINIIFYAMTH